MPVLNKQFTQKKGSVQNDADGPNPFKKFKYFDQEELENIRHKFESVST